MKAYSAIYIFLFLVIIACSPKVMPPAEQELHVVEIDERTYRINNRTIDEDAEVTAMIAPYKVQMDATMNEVIGDLDEEIFKNRPNGTLNNWFADALLEMAERTYGSRVDFAIQNYGGVRVPSITKGKVTVGKIFELMPFENKITIIRAKGLIVQQLMDRIAEYGGWPVSNTIRLTAKGGKAVSVQINGELLDIDKEYVFALPDYIANGGDNASFLDGQDRQDLNMLIRDALIEYLRTSDGKLNIDHSERIKIDNE